MATNPSRYLYQPGDEITALASVAVTGKRFVDLHSSGVIPNPNCKPAVAGTLAFGVASYDAAVGEYFTVLKEGIVKVTAGEALTAGQEVEVGVGGRAEVLDAGTKVGTVVFDAANETDAWIDLDL